MNGVAGPSWPPIPRWWEGETVCIVGAGPSLTQGQVERVRGSCRTIAINLAYRLAPWADLLYACDAKWWETYRPIFAGIKVTQDARVGRSDVWRIPSVNSPGLSLDPLRIHQGANSGYQALNLAVLLGARHVILLGYDMQAVNNKKHFHADHPSGLANPYDGLFKTWIQNFRSTLPDLKKAGVEVCNATPGSALDCFQMVTLEEALHVWR